MDKIITINLGGYAIRMEEDAYEALKPYIRQIEEKFANTENGKEIINDIEARIAEMLMERIEKMQGFFLKKQMHLLLIPPDQLFAKQQDQQAYPSSIT